MWQTNQPLGRQGYGRLTAASSRLTSQNGKPGPLSTPTSSIASRLCPILGAWQRSRYDLPQTPAPQHSPHAKAMAHIAFLAAMLALLSRHLPSPHWLQRVSRQLVALILRMLSASGRRYFLGRYTRERFTPHVSLALSRITLNQSSTRPSFRTRKTLIQYVASRIVPTLKHQRQRFRCAWKSIRRCGIPTIRQWFIVWREESPLKTSRLFTMRIFHQLADGWVASRISFGVDRQSLTWPHRGLARIRRGLTSPTRSKTTLSGSNSTPNLSGARTVNRTSTPLLSGILPTRSTVTTRRYSPLSASTTS